jgi:hypothetical protein
MPVTYTPVDIDHDCIGDHWEVLDEDELARLVGLVLKGEFAHAESILARAVSDPIVYGAGLEAVIKQDVIKALTVERDAEGAEKRETPKWHRDGLLFEVISWIVARMAHQPHVLIRDPHIGATTQGLDGLMIELSAGKDQVIQTVVFEDKCMEDARSAFRDETLPAFEAHHVSARKLLASASTLLGKASLPVTAVNAVAGRAIGLNVRKYRSAMPILPTEADQPGRARIFKNYNRLTGIGQADRIGCTFLPPADMREWFEKFALKVIAKL